MITRSNSLVKGAGRSIGVIAVKVDGKRACRRCERPRWLLICDGQGRAKRLEEASQCSHVLTARASFRFRDQEGCRFSFPGTLVRTRDFSPERPQTFLSNPKCILQSKTALLVQVIGLTSNPNLQRESARIPWFRVPYP